MRDALTPMMQQYRRLRSSIPADTLLLFRLGDFYELFFEDAKEASGLLNVALTKRNEVPMCGVPYHAAQGYIAKLIKAGKRVAICDQVSEPQPGRIRQAPIGLQLHANKEPQEVRFKGLVLETFPEDRLTTLRSDRPGSGRGP